MTEHTVLDGGNTRVKVAHFEGSSISDIQIAEDPQTLREILSGHDKGRPILSSNVGHWDFKTLLKDFSRHRELCPQTPLPWKSTYQTPETLGNDRRALVTAAYYAYPDRHVLVVDAGSCLTMDFLDQGGIYRGGAIAPGLNMRFRALHEFTAKLPLISFSESTADLIGNSTENSIKSGVLNGYRAEVMQTIAWYESRYQGLQVIITGGDAECFAHLMKNCIFAHSNFLLTGLHYILEYNA